MGTTRNEDIKQNPWTQLERQSPWFSMLMPVVRV